VAGVLVEEIDPAGPQPFDRVEAGFRRLKSALMRPTSANRSSFVYVTVIRTTPEKLWEALTDAKLIRQYWFDAIVECGWKKNSPWRKARGDGSLTDSGEILEIDPPRRMVLRWQGEWKPEFKAEGPSRCTFALEPMGGAVKLTSTHEMERPGSKFISKLCPRVGRSSSPT